MSGIDIRTSARSTGGSSRPPGGRPIQAPCARDAGGQRDPVKGIWTFITSVGIAWGTNGWRTASPCADLVMLVLRLDSTLTDVAGPRGSGGFTRSETRDPAWICRRLVICRRVLAP
jgi:hypothetical protein